ncbi:hypothetical protein AVEN_188911-1, partial [Araneus ventricosus]
ESPTSLYNSVSSQGSISDFTLYSSPSLPNISLGRPPVPTSTAELGKNGTPAGSDVQSRDMSAIRLGMPLTSNVLHSLAYYPALPGRYLFAIQTNVKFKSSKIMGLYLLLIILSYHVNRLGNQIRFTRR